jgi:membrane protease YdiL (CAAX protease family)
LVLALAVALVVFTLTHIPNQLVQSVTPADLGLDLLFILGWTLMLNVIYLVTGNLFIAVGVHALIDTPTALIAAPFPAQVAVAIAAVLVLAGERRLRAWQLRPPANILPRAMSSH